MSVLTLLVQIYSITSLLFTGIAGAAMLIGVAYGFGLKKAAKNNIANDNGLPGPQQLNSLISSLNDIIFEFNEDKVCLRVWFNEQTERVVDPNQAVGKRLEDILGYERALKFNNALDYVITNHKSTSIEYLSDHGTGNWLIAKLTPVFDREGNYTHRISASVSDISAQKKYADALKENEALLLEAQSVAKIGNWWYDRETKESYWSLSFFSILEIESVPEGLSKFEYYASMVHPDDRENHREFFYTLHTSVKKQFEHRLITPKGNLKYIKVITGGDDGEHNRIVGIIQDITENKLSEKAIKKSRAELIEAQTIAKIGNWNWDIISNTFSLSDEIRSIFQVDLSLLAHLGIKRFLLTYVHKNDKLILHQLFKGAVDIPDYSCVFRIITPKGNIKYLRIIIGNLLKNEDGGIRKIIGTLQDITDRKQAEIEYKRTENKYKLVLETIKLAAISLDSTGKVIFCNQYLANLLGYTQEEMLGMHWVDNFIPAEIKENLLDMFLGNTIPMQFINPVVCRNNEQRIISWQNTISYDENGAIKETTSIGEDITDQQKATRELISAKETAEKSSRFKSDFLSIMSHEIRTPMNAVIGTTNLLLTEDPRPEQLEYLNILKFSGENLLAIINDILDYNKIEAGKLELNLHRFNIYQLAQKIKQSFAAKAAEKGLDIELTIDETIPECITGDQMRLSQVLNNLVSNAVKFTNSGMVAIKLQAAHVNGKQVVIKFIVADTGPGIAREHLNIIFDPFMQEPVVNNSDNIGTGLGLAITKRLINLHNSDIHVISELDKGAEFTFTISFEIPQEEIKILPETGSAAMLNLQGMNVLVVDDNKMNLLIASRFLKKWQANVDEALNGEVAVEMVNNKGYDLIIMDLQMPVMDGFAATAIIKKTNPDIRIIALTADAMPETYNKALEAGMCDYLTKPFMPGVFFEKVSRYYQIKTLES